MLGVGVDAEHAAAEVGLRPLGAARGRRGDEGRLDPGVSLLERGQDRLELLRRHDRDPLLAVRHAFENGGVEPAPDSQHGLGVVAFLHERVVVRHRLGDLFNGDSGLEAVPVGGHERAAVRPPVVVGEEPDRVARAAPAGKAEPHLAGLLVDRPARIAQRLPGTGDLADAGGFQHVGAIDHCPGVRSPRHAIDVAVRTDRELGRDEVFEAPLDRLRLQKIVERQERPRRTHVARPDEGDMDHVGSFADRRLAQELLARLSPGDRLELDLDPRILLLERVERGAHFLRFGVVEAERHLDVGGGRRHGRGRGNRQARRNGGPLSQLHCSILDLYPVVSGPVRRSGCIRRAGRRRIVTVRAMRYGSVAANLLPYL